MDLSEPQSSWARLLKSTSRSRWVTSAHGRAMTIIAEKARSLNCAEVFVNSFSHTFPCHSDYSHLRTIFANIQLLFELIWTIRRTSPNRDPDALLSVAQAMRCGCEIAQPSAHHCGSVAARQPQLSQGKASPIMNNFGASPTFKSEASDRGPGDTSSVR